MKKTNLYIIGGLAVAGIAAFMFFRNKNKDASKSNEDLDVSNEKSIDTDVSTKTTKEVKGISSKPSEPIQRPPKKGGSPSYVIFSMVINKVSRLKDTPMGKRLDLASKDSTTIANLQSFVDGLSKEDKRLLGYAVYVDEKRVESGEFPKQLEAKEGSGAFKRLIEISNQFKDIAEQGTGAASNSSDSITFGNTTYSSSEFANMQSRYNNALAEAAKRTFPNEQQKTSFIKSMSGLNDLQIGHIRKYLLDQAQAQQASFADEESGFAFNGHLF